MYAIILEAVRTDIVWLCVMRKCVHKATTTSTTTTTTTTQYNQYYYVLYTSIQLLAVVQYCSELLLLNNIFYLLYQYYDDSSQLNIVILVPDWGTIQLPQSGTQIVMIVRTALLLTTIYYYILHITASYSGLTDR